MNSSLYYQAEVVLISPCLLLWVIYRYGSAFSKFAKFAPTGLILEVIHHVNNLFHAIFLFLSLSVFTRIISAAMWYSILSNPSSFGLDVSKQGFVELTRTGTPYAADIFSVLADGLLMGASFLMLSWLYRAHSSINTHALDTKPSSLDTLTYASSLVFGVLCSILLVSLAGLYRNVLPTKQDSSQSRMRAAIIAFTLGSKMILFIIGAINVYYRITYALIDREKVMEFKRYTPDVRKNVYLKKTMTRWKVCLAISFVGMIGSFMRGIINITGIVDDVGTTFITVLHMAYVYIMTFMLLETMISSLWWLGWKRSGSLRSSMQFTDMTTEKNFTEIEVGNPNISGIYSEVSKQDSQINHIPDISTPAVTSISSPMVMKVSSKVPSRKNQQKSPRTEHQNSTPQKQPNKSYGRQRETHIHYVKSKAFLEESTENQKSRIGPDSPQPPQRTESPANFSDNSSSPTLQRSDFMSPSPAQIISLNVSDKTDMYNSIIEPPKETVRTYLPSSIDQTKPIPPARTRAIRQSIIMENNHDNSPWTKQTFFTDLDENKDVKDRISMLKAKRNSTIRPKERTTITVPQAAAWAEDDMDDDDFW